MKIYSNKEYYKNVYNGKLPDSEIDEYLKKASLNITVLTFNRIIIDELSTYETKILNEVCCNQADFLYNNKELLNSLVSKYSLGDLSIDFSTDLNVQKINGIYMEYTTYQLLNQTRYTCLYL